MRLGDPAACPSRSEAIAAQLPAIGRLVEDEARRARWIGLVQALHGAVADGRLDGWLFHGTERTRAADIARTGMRRSPACVEERRGRRLRWRWTSGVHLAMWPGLAAFYAEDLIESLERQIGLSIVAVPLAVAAGRGALRSDGQSVDCPIASRLGLDDAGLALAQAEWEASAMDWRASLAYTGSLVCLGTIPAHDLHVVETPADVERLAERGLDERRAA